MIYHRKYLAILFLLVYTKICKNHVKKFTVWFDLMNVSSFPLARGVFFVAVNIQIYSWLLL